MSLLLRKCNHLKERDLFLLRLAIFSDNFKAKLFLKSWGSCFGNNLNRTDTDLKMKSLSQHPLLLPHFIITKLLWNNKGAVSVLDVERQKHGAFKLQAFEVIGR